MARTCYHDFCTLDERRPDTNMNSHWQTIGHDKAIATLSRSIQTGRMAHAWLLAGPPQVGKMSLALDIARLVNCIADYPDARPCGECHQCRRITDSLHADVRVVSQGGSNGGTTRRTAISVEQIRELQREAVLKPYEGRYRVFIIEGAENFTQEAANALLKMLEEPPEAVIFVLLASEVRENTVDESAGYMAYSPDHEQDRITALLEAVPQVGGILPTILSRCQVLELRPLPVSRVEAEIERRFDLSSHDTTEIARLSAGRLGWAIEVASDPEALTHRGERLSEIEAVLAGALDEKFAYAERIAAIFGRNRVTVYEELRLWLVWWRDVLVVHEDNDDLAVNISRLEALRLASGHCTSAQVVEAIRAIQQTISMLESNVNPRLCIEGMMLRMPQLEIQTSEAQTSGA